jgi:transposase
LRLQNSVTSSKPPSSDGLAGEQRPRGRRNNGKSRRKPGGQPGHRGHWRGLAPADRVDHVIDLLPYHCRHCDCSFSGKRRQASPDIEPRRHQVTELPAIEAHITEYRCQSTVCPDCGKATQAELPQEVQGHFGPELTALIAYLTVVCRMPRRVVQELLGQVLGMPLSLGSIQNSWEEASEAVAEPCTELEKQLVHEPVINSDETGYRTSGDKRWLWALVATSFVFYKIALTRGAGVLVQLLGEVFAGILCSDRCPTYLKYYKGEGQFWVKIYLTGPQFSVILDSWKSTHLRLFRKQLRTFLTLITAWPTWWRSAGRWVLPAPPAVTLAWSTMVKRAGGSAPATILNVSSP